jgi:tetratricopeptide (TPR) repeat protein
MRKREPRWQSAADRARVAAELIEEAESLSENSTIATPAEVARASLPPPIRAELPDPAPPATAGASEEGAAAATAAPGLDELLEREPENVGLLLQRAEVLCARRHYRAAQRDLERALRQEPGNVDARATLGLVQARKGLWSEAAAQLKGAVDLDPDRTAAWCYLGEALNHLDDLTGALAAFEHAAELEPGNAKALYGCGIVLDRLNRPVEATQMYRRSREAAGR